MGMDYRGTHTVTVVVRVNSATKKEAIAKVLACFPDRFWPGLAKQIVKVERGWRIADPPRKRYRHRLLRRSTGLISHKEWLEGDYRDEAFKI